MGAVASLSDEQLEALYGHEHPLDTEAVRFSAQRMAVGRKRARTVLLLFDTCFCEQNPKNYREDWDSITQVGRRMYRTLDREDFDVLFEVVESARDVNFSFKDASIVVDAHKSYMQRHMRMDVTELCLVVHHPEVSEPIDL